MGGCEGPGPGMRARQDKKVKGRYAKEKMSEVSVDKSLLAFLNGISKRLYFGEDNITDEFLRDEVLQVPEEGMWEQLAVVRNAMLGG